jgi:hypothetical protein
MCEEYFVALEENTVRGAYILKPQAFSFGDGVKVIADYRLPIAEGIVNSHYAIVGLLMLKDALNRHPLLFALGMGGFNYALPRMLKMAKWRMVSCPFYYKVNHPFRFLHEIAFLRRKRSRQLILDILAFSGLGWMAINALQSLKGFRWKPAADVAVEEVESFSSWADEIWVRAKDDYAMIAVRDSCTLNMLYPSHEERFRRIKVLRQDSVVGWAVVLNTKMKENKYFGNMQVGSVVDCLAFPGQENHVARMASRYLEDYGVDIIVTNQLQRSWCKAFARNGYLPGPSNFIFAASPQLAARLDPFEVNVSRVHMTRGDGDGPISL